MFDLLHVVHLQQVIAPKLNISQLLVVFKEINWKCNLTGGVCSCKQRQQMKLISNKPVMQDAVNKQLTLKLWICRESRDMDHEQAQDMS